MNKSAGLVVRDDGVAGSNPATPTSFRTETRTDTPISEPRDIFGVNEARPDEPLGFPGKEHFAKWPFLQDVPRLTYFSGSLDLRELRRGA